MASRPRKQPASKRVVWTEPGREHGGEFRLTWGRLAGIFTVLAAIPSIWAIGGHYMNKEEIQAQMASNKADTDRALKEHAAHDASAQAWGEYNLAAGLAANRVEYLDDKQAECDAKRLTMSKLTPADQVICTRIETKLRTKNAELVDLKAKAKETTKEKPQ